MADRVLSKPADACGGVTLVIDDFHELTSPEALAQLTRLLTNLPAQVTAILTTRHDVRLGLHQLRLAGELAEIRAADLRFSERETREVRDRSSAVRRARELRLLDRSPLRTEHRQPAQHRGIDLGWFQGGFAPSTNATATAPAACATAHNNVNGTSEVDYSAHHEPFQYYQSTSNPHHLPPSSPSMIGHTDQANHQYDISQFWVAANAGNMPAVSFLKAPRYQDGHPANSDPLDEQTFLVNTINALEKLPTWSSTAVIINWDDSDGRYDHVIAPIVNPSNDPSNDKLDGTNCGTTKAGLTGDQCGDGPRLPLLVVSPYAKANYVDSTLTDQSSILKFVEDNWNLGRIGTTSSNWPGRWTTCSTSTRREWQLILDPTTGVVVSSTFSGLPANPAPAVLATAAPPTSIAQTTAAHSQTTLTDAGPSGVVFAAIGVMAMGALGLGAGLGIAMIGSKSKGGRGP